MSRRLKSRESTRSSSTPPWFAQNCGSSAQDLEGERTPAKDSELGRRRLSNGYGSNGLANSNSRGPSKRKGTDGKAQSSPSPSNPRPAKMEVKDSSGEEKEATSTPVVPVVRTPQMSTTDPECEVIMPEDEEFLEGGVELSPPRRGEMLGEVHLPPPATRPLSALEDCQLEEFWPSGTGLKALFLDYDGTLREFEARPEMATPTPELRELLTALNAREDFAPHIISGRNASFLEAHFQDYPRFTLVAEHGFQIWKPDVRAWVTPDDTTDQEMWKSEIRRGMTQSVNEMPGSHLEEKASSLVWHYREVANMRKAEEKADEVVTKLGKLVEDGNLTDVRISRGHKIVEASYQKVRKGPVMRKMCEEKAIFGEPFVGVLTAGDDVGDESMFDAAPSDYLTIKVGEAETSARCRVANPAELRAFLWRLLRRSAGTGSST